MQLLLWTALQSQNRAKQTERGFCPPPDISHRLFTASLHVGTVYEPRGRRCQDATSAQRTQNLSQPPTVPEVPEIQRRNTESHSASRNLTYKTDVLVLWIVLLFQFLISILQFLSGCLPVVNLILSLHQQLHKSHHRRVNSAVEMENVSPWYWFWSGVTRLDVSALRFNFKALVWCDSFSSHRLETSVKKLSYSDKRTARCKPQSDRNPGKKKTRVMSTTDSFSVINQENLLI